jgi:Uma2 family endonuclease
MMTVTMLSGPFTREALDAMPEDGRRHELLDGALVVTPAPSPAHQRCVARLLVGLAAACPADLDVLVAPLDVELSADTVLQPDLLVAPRVQFGPRSLPGVPLLAVEVLSPSTHSIDLGAKLLRYERAGCPAYWVVDPEEPVLTAWELDAGRYRQVARVAGADAADLTRPFPVSVTPVELVR